VKNQSLRPWWVNGIVTMAVGGSLALGVSSCSSNPRPAFVVDCSVMDQYQLSPPEQNALNSYPWYGYGDMTPGALAMSGDAGEADGGGSPIVQTIPGGVCGIQDALVLRSYGHQDYGSGFIDHAFAGFLPGSACGPDGGPPDEPAQYANESQYEGLSFWARNPGQTTKGVTLELTDIHSSSAVVCPTPGECVQYSTDAGNNVYVAMGSNGTIPSGSSVATAQPPADSCGNYFTVALVTSENWQFYTVPFSSFHQGFQPDRVPSGLDTSKLAQFIIVVPKEAVVDLWIANLGFYRKKGPEAGP
jgi:hypothetical protein